MLLREKTKRISKRKKTSTRLIEKINAAFTIILVITTIIYAYITYQQANISNKLLLLSAEPNVSLSWANPFTIQNNKIFFTIKNNSLFDIKDVKIYDKYFTIIYDELANEHIIQRGDNHFSPSHSIALIETNDSTKFVLDFKKSSLKDTNRTEVYGGLTKPQILSSSKFNKKGFTYCEVEVRYRSALDRKSFKESFYFWVIIPDDNSSTEFIPSTKEFIHQSGKEMAVRIRMLKKLIKEK